jgi:hypothetical protein
MGRAGKASSCGWASVHARKVALLCALSLVSVRFLKYTATSVRLGCPDACAASWRIVQATRRGDAASLWTERPGVARGRSGPRKRGWGSLWRATRRLCTQRGET